MSGLSVVGQDKYGVFPLKGYKLLNVRESSPQQLQRNPKIQNIKNILGLQFGKSYENVKELRYGHLIIMAEQVCSNNCYYALTVSAIFYAYRKLHVFCRIMLVHTSKGY